MKKKIYSGVIFVILIIIAKAIGTGLRVVEGIVEGQHGAPSFVTPGFQIFAVISLLLFILAYFCIGKNIPIRNRILRGLVFAVFFIASDYLPQIMGMMGGTSAFIDADAFSLPTILIDSVGYLLNGMILGYFILPKEEMVKKKSNTPKYVLAILCSAICFPTFLGIFEVIAGMINSNMYCINSFGISRDTSLSFYIVFYLFQAVSGAVTVMFYRYTEYNRFKGSWVRFASAFGILLWLPVVLIVIFFGVRPLVTIAWGVMMVAAIYLDTLLFAKIMRK